MAGWGDEDDDYSFGGVGEQQATQTQSAAYRDMLSGGGNRRGGAGGGDDGYSNVFDMDEQDEELYNDSYGNQQLNGDGYAATTGGSAPGEMGGDDYDTSMADSTYKRKRRKKLFCVGLLLLIIGGLVVALAIIFSNRSSNEGGSSNNNLGVNEQDRGNVGGAPTSKPTYMETTTRTTTGTITAMATADPPSSRPPYLHSPLHRMISGTALGRGRVETRVMEAMSRRRRCQNQQWQWEEVVARCRNPLQWIREPLPIPHQRQ